MSDIDKPAIVGNWFNWAANCPDCSSPTIAAHALTSTVVVLCCTALAVEAVNVGRRNASTRQIWFGIAALLAALGLARAVAAWANRMPDTPTLIGVELVEAAVIAALTFAAWTAFNASRRTAPATAVAPAEAIATVTLGTPETAAPATNGSLLARVHDFAALYRKLPVMLLTTDRDGYIIEVNDTWLARMGYDRDSVIGRRARDFVAGNRPVQVVEAIERTFWRSGAIDAIHQTLLRRDGTTFAAETSAVVQGQGKDLLAHAVTIDVTSRSAAETRMRVEASELGRANEGLAQFAYIASHDLQEPLRKIIAFSDVLNGAVTKNKPEDIRYAAGVMRDAAIRARQLVGDLLAYSRSANAEIRLIPIELRAGLQAVISDLSATIHATNAEVKLTVVDVTIQADKTQFANLIENLLSNSIKYHKLNQTPHVEIIGSRNPDNSLTLEIVDDGIGFDQSHDSIIFEPFKRLHTRSEYPGSGIGLAICKTIVDRHGWTISVRSNIGEGSRFRLTIPDASQQIRD